MMKSFTIVSLVILVMSFTVANRALAAGWERIGDYGPFWVYFWSGEVLGDWHSSFGVENTSSNTYDVWTFEVTYNCPGVGLISYEHTLSRTIKPGRRVGMLTGMGADSPCNGNKWLGWRVDRICFNELGGRHKESCR